MGKSQRGGNLALAHNGRGRVHYGGTRVDGLGF
jgi:hypothetical protein